MEGPEAGPSPLARAAKQRSPQANEVQVQGYESLAPEGNHGWQQVLWGIARSTSPWPPIFGSAYRGAPSNDGEGKKQGSRIC